MTSIALPPLLPKGQYSDAKNDLLHGIWDQLSLINGRQAADLLNRSVKGGFGNSTEDILFQIFGELGKLSGPLANRLKETVNVKDFGAVGDGISDDTQAFQDALNYAFTSGIKAVVVPRGNYLITNTVTIPIGVVLSGIVNKPTYKTTLDANIDSLTIVVKTAQSTGTPVFIILYNAGIRNLAFYWPLQLKTNVNPIQYGWAITTNGLGSNGDGILIENITLTNCYNGINIDFGGQWDMRNIKGQALNIGIQLDRVFDVARMSDIHFWDFWALDGDPIKPYILNNAEAIRIGRVDGIQGTNIFVWGHKNLLHFYNSVHDNAAESGAAWCMLTNVQSDICKVPIQIDRANFIQLNNVNGTSYDISSGFNFIETGIDVSGNVSITNFNAFHANALANIKSTTGTFKFTNVSRQNRGDGNDVRTYKIINQSTANVFIDEADYNEVSGLVQIGANVKWSSDTDITASVTNFSNFLAWNVVDPRVSAIANGFRFLLSGGVAVNRFNLPNTFSTNAGVYVLELDIQLNNPTLLGPAQFYLRLSDNTINDLIMPASATVGYFVQKTRLRIPFIIRQSGLSFDFVFGNALGAASMDITNVKLYQMAGYKTTRTLVDWLHTKQPNSLNSPLPTVLK